MPHRTESRQYRSFEASNFQPIAHEDQLDENGNQVEQEQSYKTRGYWTVFSTEYELYPRMGDWPAEYEQIDPHAFDDADMSDVIFQLNHEGSPLARQRNGSLSIGIDSHGGWAEADLGGCQQGRDVFESIQNGLIAEMSFGFTIADDENGYGATYTRDEQGDYHTTITRVSKVFDVSCVSIPASPATEIHARSAIGAAIEADRKAEEQRIADEQAEQERIEQEDAQRRSLLRLRRRARALSMM